MSLRQSLANPFYVLLLVAGVAFSLTACAYGVMTVRGLRHGAAVNNSGVLLLAWLDEHGFTLMLVELGILAVFCFLAIATDGYWERRYARKSEIQRAGDTR